jgi:IPT/TIG domain
MRKWMSLGSVLALLGAVACAIGGSAAAKSFDAPTITSVSPKTGVPGTHVTISGTSFNRATVTFVQKRVGATPITVPAAATTINSTGTQITVTVPDGTDIFDGKMASPGGNTLSVTTPEGTVTTSFTAITDPNATRGVPIITYFRPLKARPGASVTIFGTHLSGVKKVSLGTAEAGFKVTSDNRIVATVPRSAGSGKWSIRWSGGSVSSPKSLTVAHAM